MGIKLGCEDGDKSATQPKGAVARVKGQYLYQKDLENIKFDFNNPQDSLALVDRYIQSWVAKQVLISEAEEQGEYQQADIERKILAYKYDLIVHSYIEKLVNNKLNKSISEEEIHRYYQAYQDNFTLKYPVVRGKFIIVPKEAPNQSNLRKLLTSKQAADITALKNYCNQFAKDYSLDDTVWLNWSELISKTPFNKVPDKTRLLKKTNFTEIEDEACRYYLKIDAYRIIGDIAPFDLIKEQIMNVILYKRKLALANQIKEDLLQKAKTNHEVTIYNYQR